MKASRSRAGFTWRLTDLREQHADRNQNTSVHRVETSLTQWFLLIEMKTITRDLRVNFRCARSLTWYDKEWIVLTRVNLYTLTIKTSDNDFQNKVLFITSMKMLT